MVKFFNNFIRHNHWFWILLFASIVLLVASFICPPTGVIDPSVIAAVGELAGFGAIGAVIKGIENGTGVKLSKGNIEMEIKTDD